MLLVALITSSSLAGVSLAMNELRPCAPLSLKHALAQQIILGLQEVSEALLHYNSTRVLRQNESALFLSLCQVFLEVLTRTLSSLPMHSQRAIELVDLSGFRLYVCIVPLALVAVILEVLP